MKKTISTIVSGKVQGVFFRQCTKEKAIELSLTGEVRNKKDGTVHIIAAGADENLNQLIDWCHRGPERARVTGVDVKEVEDFPSNTFTIAR